MHTLEADSIQLAFGLRKVLTDVYLRCETGKITGLLGSNGSGKSSLLNIIYGTRSNYDKSVRINGQYFATPYKHPELIRYLPQQRFIPQGIKLSRVFNDYEIEYTAFENTFPDLMFDFNAALHGLSTGQQRLVEVYIILKSKSQFVLLDEPFSFLAPVQVDRFKEIIAEEEKNKGIIITDHLYGHILELSDSLYILKDGKLHLSKSIEDITRLGYARF